MYDDLGPYILINKYVIDGEGRKSKLRNENADPE